ncbi:threonine dehydratase I [Microstroma glucosiphilum]|uniref:Threonine dehydratase n=1 Tax=Pseudomicrostroma glucosiphilum TaxID=1684307 RepID=A0A316U8M5_9BASI|nr:threonine dehydratase I [Pseudomicrostroma glucosiphilum]PWN21519.1 threonine dehydratase I [Pseudomicrostroma glucosiphilum]
MPSSAQNGRVSDPPMPPTTALPTSAYLAAPFVSSKALGESTSTVQADPDRSGRGASSQASSSSSSSSPPSASSPMERESSIPSYLYSSLPSYLLLPSGTPDYLRMCLSADIYSLVKTTPLQRANKLSTKLGCEIFLKREDLQPVFSFKLRGAYNLMRTLEGEQKWKGVIACSAGNHAQGVSLSGLSLSIPCTIVMPLGTPAIKVDSVRALGAKVVLHGQDFDEAKAECSRLAETYGLKVIPPFDDPHVIAGQGTVGVEILRQTSMDDLDGVFCCVGGGGLLAGVSSYVKRIAPPSCKVFGVETFDGDALTQSLQAGRRITLREVGLFADGTAVKVVGEECFRILREKGAVDGMVRVDTDEICAAIRDTFEDTRTVPEPSGALSLAGLKRYIISHNLQNSGKKFACIISGANMNFSRLRFVAERAEVGDGKEVLMMVEIPEVPGAFMKLHSHIHPRSVTEFSYRYNVTEESGSQPPTAHIFLSFLLGGGAPPPGAVGIPPVPPANVGQGAQGNEHHTDHEVRNDVRATLAAHFGRGATLSATESPLTNGSSNVNGNGDGNGNGESASADGNTAGAAPGTSISTQAPSARDAELRSIMDALSNDGMRAIDISGNEMAKSHARYLVGGKQNVPHERIFRFEFPERPGALRKFLAGLNAGWNISLFHYRNHGSDIARILAGIQVTPGSEEAFDKFLEELGYVYKEETGNEVVKKFL